MGTYNLLYHILTDTVGVLPCVTLCYHGGYFAGHRDQFLVESLNDAITILSGTGTQLGQNVPGFGTTDIAKWGYQPAQDQNWDSLDPLAAGVTTHCGTSASQNRSTFMMGVDVGRTLTGQDELPPGQSGVHLRRGHAQPAPVRPGRPVQRLPVQEHAAELTPRMTTRAGPGSPGPALVPCHRLVTAPR